MLSPRRALTLLFLTALAATASANIPPPTAPSTAPAAPSTREQLELAVAQVCVNEAGFWRFEDCDLIWQTTARFASDEARRPLAGLTLCRKGATVALTAHLYLYAPGALGGFDRRGHWGNQCGEFVGASCANLCSPCTLALLAPL